MSRKTEGWTLMELLIVVAIIGVLAALFILTNWKKSLYRASDARRKTDLVNIRRAFEEYYNDHECYPSTDVLSTCGGTGLAPYLAKVPCDPESRSPYHYEPDSSSNVCLGNRICAELRDLADPDITKIGCSPVNGCGWGTQWNYCLAAGTTVTSSGFNPAVAPSVTPVSTPSYAGVFACRQGTGPGGETVGVCNNVGDAAALGCPRSFAESDCQGLCSNSVNWCP